MSVGDAHVEVVIISEGASSGVALQFSCTTHSRRVQGQP